jgi:hypothetical protein
VRHPSQLDFDWTEKDLRLDAFCITVVAGVPLDAVLGRFDADLGTDTRATFVESFNPYPERAYVVADEVDGGVIVGENNGWWGVDEDVLTRVSVGGRAAALYRSVNADMTLGYAQDGVLVAYFDPLLDPVPDQIVADADDLSFEDEVTAPSLALLARLTGVRLEPGWLDDPHSRFEVPQLP